MAYLTPPSSIIAVYQKPDELYMYTVLLSIAAGMGIVRSLQVSHDGVSCLLAESRFPLGLPENCEYGSLIKFKTLPPDVRRKISISLASY